MSSQRGAVLVVTSQFDPSADRVVQALARRAYPVFRCDVAEFPRRLKVIAEIGGAVHTPQWQGELVTPHRTLPLTDVAGAYYRRPTGFEFPSDLAAADVPWAGLQARLGVGGLLAATPNWLNHPHRIGFAEYKPVQLRAAIAAGLRVPPTLLTNDPQAAANFAELHGDIVYKALASGGIGEGQPSALYTTRIGATDVDSSIALTAHMFQEWIVKEYEVRLTVVDSKFFAARITAHSTAAKVDWRSDYDALDYTVIPTPPVIQVQVQQLLAGLGLRFAALDFAVTSSGDWIFFDLNPNGQWGWIEAQTGLPICDAIADALVLGAS